MDSNDFSRYNTKEFQSALKEYYVTMSDDDNPEFNRLNPLTQRLFKALLERFYFATRKAMYFVLEKFLKPDEASKILNCQPCDRRAPKLLHINFDKKHFGESGEIDNRRHQMVYATQNTAVPRLLSTDYGGFSKNYAIPQCLQDILLALELLSPPHLFGEKQIRCNYFQFLISQPPSTVQRGFHVDSAAQNNQNKLYLKQLPMLQISIMIGIQQSIPSAGIHFQNLKDPILLSIGDICVFRADQWHQGLAYSSYNRRAFVQSCTIFYPMSQTDIGLSDDPNTHPRVFKGKRKLSEKGEGVVSDQAISSQS
jgi:hypothetical protein